MLDPFIGSGAIAIAAKRLGRHYIGIDNKPEYVKLAQHALAETVIDPLVNIEAARTTPLPKTVRKLASALGVEPEKLD